MSLGRLIHIYMIVDSSSAFATYVAPQVLHTNDSCHVSLFPACAMQLVKLRKPQVPLISWALV